MMQFDNMTMRQFENMAMGKCKFINRTYVLPNFQIIKLPDFQII